MLSRLRSLLIVLASVTIATLLTFPLSRVAVHSLSLLFMAAVILASRYGGVLPGICTALLSVLVFNWFFDSTPYTLDLTWSGAIRTLVFSSVSFLVASLENQRRQAISSLEDANKQLRISLHEIKVLRGILPVCAYCKQIRNEAGAWEQMEGYIRQHSELDFTHGVCPACLKTHFPETYEKMYLSRNIAE